MAKSDNIDLPYGSDGETISVPAWSTETTLSAVASYSEATAKALNAMLHSQGRQGKVAADNTDIFKNILSSQKSTVEAVVEGTKADKKREKRKQSDFEKDARARSKSFVESMDKQDLEGMTRAVAGAGLLGAAAGMAVGVIVRFSKELTELSNIGVGFGDSLLELKGYATATGMDLGNFGKLVSGNLNSMIALGDTVANGAREFSALSRQVRDLADDYNNFGMTNMEMNQTIADEIELRRKSGMQQSLIADSVAASMNDLMLETSALASITGQDRREVMRARQEAMNDNVTASFIGELDQVGQDNVLAMNSALANLGPLGEKIASGITNSMATGIDISAVNGGELGKIMGLSPEIGRLIHSMNDFVQGNALTADADVFGPQLVAQAAGFSTALSESDARQLRLYATVDSAVSDMAREILGLSIATNGLNESVADNQAEYDRMEADIAASKLIGLASTLEETIVTLQTAYLETTVGLFDKLSVKLGGAGDSIGEAGAGIITALEAVTTAYTDTGVVDGTKRLIQSLDGQTQIIIGFGAAIAAATTLLGGRGGGDGDGDGGGGGGLLQGGILALTGQWLLGKTRAAGSMLTNLAKAGGQSIVQAARVSGPILAQTVRTTATSMALKTAGAAASTAALAAVAAVIPTGLGDGTMNGPYGEDPANWPTSPTQAVIDAGGMNMTPEEIKEFNNPTPVAPMDTSGLNRGLDNVRPTESGALQTNITPDNAWRHGERGQQYLEEQQRNQTTELVQMNRHLRQLLTAFENN
jgi:hypothetical protein